MPSPIRLPKPPKKRKLKKPRKPPKGKKTKGHRTMKIMCTALLLVLCGCAGMTPALAGKTTYSQTFSDTEAATENGPGQTTTYSLDIKAPAGVKLDDITGMSYTWDPEKGQININKSGTTDTTLQATAILEAQKQIVDAMLAGFTTAAGLAAPLVGQRIDVQGANQAAEIQNKAARQALIADIVKQVVAAIPAPTPQIIPPTVAPRLPSTLPVTPPGPLDDGTLAPDTNLSPEN